MYYPCENKAADQLCSYGAADLCLCFTYADYWFSYVAAHLKIVIIMNQRKELFLDMQIHKNSDLVLVPFLANCFA